MRYQLLAHVGATIIEVLEISSLADVSDMISLSYEHDSDLFLMDASVLPPSFFDLRSGFAGELVQKLVNHRLKTALVLESALCYPTAFQAFAQEASGGAHLRRLGSRDTALAWLSTCA